jgi:hypothetical protein
MAILDTMRGWFRSKETPPPDPERIPLRSVVLFSSPRMVARFTPQPVGRSMYMSRFGIMQDGIEDRGDVVTVVDPTMADGAEAFDVRTGEAVPYPVDAR